MFKYSLMIGFGGFLLMIIDYKLLLPNYHFFGYIEFWGTIVLVCTVIYIFTKKVFIASPDIMQSQMFFQDFAIVLFGALIYGVSSVVYITFIEPDYSNAIYNSALLHFPKSANENTAGDVLGIALITTPYVQFVFKFIGVGLLGTFYSIFVVNHFLWIKELLNKYKSD